jgi:TRAP-type mannitol/chloroaromatic compound transport system permease small subunit
LTGSLGLARAIDSFNEHVGRAVAWFGLIMVLVQFAVVIMRYVFAFGSIPVQESILYFHGILFLLGAGYTLNRGGHVRVDIFYREASPRKKAAIDLFGIIVFLLPVCLATWWYGWSYVVNSWNILEGSQEPLGLHLVFLLKTFVLAFAFLVAIQGVSIAIKCILRLRGIDVPDQHDLLGL